MDRKTEIRMTKFILRQMKNGQIKKSKEKIEKTKKELQRLEDLENINLKKYVSIKGHQYRGENLRKLNMLSKEGVFGTYNQWKENNRQVSKGEKGIKLKCPIFKKNEDGEKELQFMKSFTVFHKEQTEKIKQEA